MRRSPAVERTTRPAPPATTSARPRTPVRHAGHGYPQRRPDPSGTPSASDTAGAVPAHATDLVAGGVRWARAALGACVVAWLAMVTAVVTGVVRDRGSVTAWGLAVVVAYLAVVTVLSFASAMHLTARLGAAHRLAAHAPATLAEVRAFLAERRPSVTVLVPSYREEVDVIRRTLLSAALQEAVGLRVVLLIDDPPHPTPGSEAALQLERARHVVDEAAATLREPFARADAARRAFEARVAGATSVGEFEINLLVAQFATAARTVRQWSQPWLSGDHAERFFANEVLGSLADQLTQEARRLSALAAPTASVAAEEVRAGYRRLCAVFGADFDSFERKRYASLSHEPNKAMNLNAYLALMGRTCLVDDGPRGLVLREVDGSREMDGSRDVADDGARPTPGVSDGLLTVPDSDYVLTLDADSVLLPGYVPRLVHLMESRGNERVAVAQTPYCAFPGTSSDLERIAGATTDVQYVLHQGMTHYGATFWVGANAVLRRQAIEDIAVTSIEDGIEVRRYIQDRTVIEDTESSLDLQVRGWTLVNYPERLAYSATPPDFGSLVIQRRRWANGGLIILPRLGSLLRARRRRRERSPIPGLLLQFHYLTSTPAVGLALLAFLALPTAPLDGIVPPVLVPALMAPYLAVLIADLPRLGYRRSDVLRVYALNLQLVAVNLAGAFRSLQQAALGHKTPFVRTPKVQDRVAAPASFILLPLMGSVLGLAAAAQSLAERPGVMVAFTIATATLTLYGLVALIGARAAAEDVRSAAGERLARIRAGAAPVIVPAPTAPGAEIA